MIKKIISLILSNFIFLSALIAQKESKGFTKWVDAGVSAGQSQGAFSLSYNFAKKIGKKQKWEIGAGLRLTSYIGSKKDFITAGPAKYTRSFTLPFLIVFAGQNEVNFDTLTVQRPFTNSLNLQFNLGYHFSDKWYAGCNIDLIGGSFGRKGSAVFTSNGQTTTDPNVKPSPFNLLLTGDHDKGSLNSEFLLGYSINKKIRVKAFYQFIFIEYKSQSVLQVFDDGITNNRFRNKANNLGIGLSYFIF